MARDVKLIQHGVNVQANDLAVPPGTPLRAVNIDYQRDGVAQRRIGFDRFDAGLPWVPIDISRQITSAGVAADMPLDRGVFELFSRDRPMLVSGGLVFQYEEATTRWYSVPVNMPHRFTFFGDAYYNQRDGDSQYSGLGRAVMSFENNEASAPSLTSPLHWQQSGALLESFTGTPGNDTTQAAIPTASTLGRYYQPADMAFVFVSDYNSIRYTDGTILAGSLTATGSTNGTGTAATFLNASWAATDRSDVYVADNTNQIRKVTSAGVVTTVFGSITAGDVDGVGTAARFRGISGMTFASDGFLYVVESGGHRVRKCNTSTGSVTIYAGALTPTAGYVNAVGTAARFNTPIGIEVIGNTLYVGDSVNHAIRAIARVSADVTLYAGHNGGTTAGMIGGPVLSAYLPTPSLRGKYTPVVADNSKAYLIVECVASASTIDVGLIYAQDSPALESQSVFHIVRCPSAYPTLSGPNKLDTIGPNAYALTDSRGVDVGSGVVFTTSERPRAIDIWTRLKATDPQPRFRSLGVLAPEAPSVTVTTGTTFAGSMTWAYRTVCGLKLPDGRITLGPPSERVVCAGSITAVAGSLTVYPSPGLPYDGLPFVQVYRTRTFANTLDPGDQMFLCYESALSYGAGLQVVDQLPDALLGSELYTNQTELGIAGTALPPVNFATEVASFQQQVVLSNYIPQASVRVKVLGVTSLSAGTSTVSFATGVTSYLGKTLTLTAYSITVPASNQFAIASGGTAAQNAVQTARNMVECVNRSPDAYMFQAQYDEGDPGAVVVTSLFPGLSAQTVAYSRTGLSTVVSTNNQATITFSTNASTSFITIQANVSTRKINALAYSDQNAFDSFPGPNSFTCGPATEAIQRTLPISDTLLVVKDDSVWRTDDSFVPQIYDVALTCSLPDSFARVNNQWIGLFTRGFVTLNSSQAVASGRVIDRDVTAQYGSYISGRTTDFASAAAIDVTGNYLCTFNRRTYCYNAIAQSWSEWQINSLASQYPSAESTSTSSQESGMLALGAFRDSFISTADSVRSVYRQRDFRRDLISSPSTALWYRNYSDASYVFSGTLSADKLSITVSAYASTSNPGILPPKYWVPPAGAVANTSNNSATFAWVLEVTQSAVVVTTQGKVVATTPTSATSAMTLTLATALTEFTTGAVTVVAYAPIICRVQYAPFAAPGSGAQFGTLLTTLERAQPGWLVARFFDRKDQGNAAIYADGPYLDTAGVSRALLMPSITVTSYGIGATMSYHDIQRFEPPSERACDQLLGVELWEGNAWQPLAIKVVTVDKRVTETSKVVR